MSSYESIPKDLRNTIDNLQVNDTVKKSFVELWRLFQQIANGDVEQAKPQFEAFLNQLQTSRQPQQISDIVDAEIARLEDDFMIGGRKRKSRKNKKSSKKKRRSKKSVKRRR